MRRRAAQPPVPPGNIRRPRLFTLLLLAFALVIVLGVGGMAGFYTLAAARFGPHAPTGYEFASEQGRLVSEQERLVAAQALAEYYAARGSWIGVDTQVLVPRFGRERDALSAYTLLDAEGQVVAVAPWKTGTGELTSPFAPGETIPIELDNRRIGTLILTPRLIVPGAGSFAEDRSNTIRGFISATLALAAVLLGLAAFFSSRLSRPLIRLTQAAQTVAAGDLSARVDNRGVREIAELGQAFNTMADSLVQADQQRRQLTADVAHELRTPLSIIRGRLEGMQDGIYTATPEQIGVLLDETALLERLIEDLRLLALADAGQLPLYPEPFDPAALLHDVARSFAPQAQAGGVVLQVQATPGLPEVQADPQRIAQVLGNLVSNALRHTPAGGTITLQAGWAPGPGRTALVLAVADTGSGIAPADLPRIFDRFWRADRARTRAGGGAGLGLVIARRIVEAHGGRIWAASAPGQGTTISFSLPLPAITGRETRSLLSA
jgi:two-component system OmpR family sensor kinase/two-component system sensor histidine kinase BaeS